MKLTSSLKTNFVYLVALLHIILFTYAAVSKLIDFENFQVQIGQSPLLSAFAGAVSYGVPAIEIVLSFFLLLPRHRITALYGSCFLMFLFSIYIVMILNFTPFVPCSCGGVLDKLGWNEHLVFNFVFVALGIIVMLLDTSFKRTIRNIFIGGTIGIATIVSLFFLSENTIHHRNNFVRRFPHHPAMLKQQYNLKHTSYYLAGIDNGKIYFANTIAPLAMTVLDTALKNKTSFRIALPSNNYTFKNVKVTVKPPYFYLGDGTVPVIFRGKTSDWKAELWMHNNAYFSKYVVISPDKIAIRAISSKNGENILGTITKDNTIKVQLNNKLLTKQIDGVFDTDGYFLYNNEQKQLLYNYAYRNQYLQIDTLLNKIASGKTIDTVSKAHIKVAYIDSRKESKFSAPPLIVNKNAATFGRYLFVNAGLLGKYEPRDSWNTSSVIDVYDLTNNSYRFSFYIEDTHKQKMTDFMVHKDLLVAVMGSYVVTYKLGKTFKL